MSDSYENYDQHSHEEQNQENPMEYQNHDHSQDQGLDSSEPQATPEADPDALQALWLAAAQEAPTVEDLELAELELQEAEKALTEKRETYQLGVLERARVFGRGQVSEELTVSRKALATWEAELAPEGDDLSSYYEELKKNQEREERRAQKAAERAAQEAANLQRLLDRISNR